MYPEIQPYKITKLQVSTLHTLYVEECGNPSGVPVVFLHGGPGSGIQEKHRRFFDPKRFRAVLFDQRGAGKSTPRTSLEKNTTWELVSDMEKIREELGIERWILFGGSWGSTLALVYGINHPNRVAGFVLRGTFLARPAEHEWFCGKGWNQLFPDYWDRFVEYIPEEERDDLFAAYYRRLTGNDEKQALEAALAWSEWETAALKLNPKPEEIAQMRDPAVILPFAKIECHYFVNNCFLKPDYILNNIEKIRHLPATIIHGRFDVVCPLTTSWDLHKAWPGSKLEIIPMAGHASDEPGVVEALIKAVETLPVHIN